MTNPTPASIPSTLAAPTANITPDKRIVYTLIGLILPLAGAHRILHFRQQLGRLI